MNQSLSQSYQSLGQSVGYSYSGTEKRISQCEEAYEYLRGSLAELEGSVSNLASRLNPVLSHAVPAINQNGPSLAPAPSESEVHGWLMATQRRIDELRLVVNDLHNRTTV